MIKKNLKIIIGLLVVILAISFLVFNLVMRGKSKDDPFKVPNQTYEEDIKPQVFSNDKVKVTIYIPNDKLDGYIKKEVELTGEGTEIQKQIINYVLFDTIKKSGKIQIPDNAKVVDLKIWDETLKVNFSKDILNAKINSPKQEKYIVGAIVNSLLISSNSFADVQFLVDGKNVDKLFGHFNTKNPLMKIQ